MYAFVPITVTECELRGSECASGMRVHLIDGVMAGHLVAIDSYAKGVENSGKGERIVWYSLTLTSSFGGTEAVTPGSAVVAVMNRRRDRLCAVQRCS